MVICVLLNGKFMARLKLNEKFYGAFEILLKFVRIFYNSNMKWNDEKGSGRKAAVKVQHSGLKEASLGELNVLEMTV